MYEGDYADNKKHGVGKFIYKDGGVYQGMQLIEIRNQLAGIDPIDSTMYSAKELIEPKIES